VEDECPVLNQDSDDDSSPTTKPIEAMIAWVTRFMQVSDMLSLRLSAWHSVWSTTEMSGDNAYHQGGVLGLARPSITKGHLVAHDE
jgi:hypothetical protein